VDGRASRASARAPGDVVLSVRSRPSWVGGFGAWSLLVWGSRIRNIWADDELSTSGQVGRTLLALSFVIGGAAMLVLLARARSRRFTRAEVAGVSAFAVWTIGVWVVRGSQIVAGGHSAGFVVVHTALAVVSIGLAAGAWHAARAPRRVSPELVGHR